MESPVTRRRFAQTSAAAVASAALAGPEAFAQRRPDGPNVILLIVDSLRADAVYDGWVRTPNIDALARQGPDGEYLGFFQNNTAFLMYHVPSQSFVALPPGKEFDNTSTFSAPYTPPLPGGGTTTAPPTPDTTRPGVRRLRMTKRRFRVRRRATAFRFALSEPADVRIVIRRRGRRAGALRRPNRPAGANSIRFGGRLRGRKLPPGRYVAILTATDAAGNRTIKRTLFRILR